MAEIDYTDEEWRTIADAPDYEVSNKGRVRRPKNTSRGRYAGIRKGYWFGRYLRFNLLVDGKVITRAAHVLVCTAWNGPRPTPRHHCAHIDDDRTNNTLENLYWATPEENEADKTRNGRRPTRLSPEGRARLSRGDNHWTHKYPEKLARGDAHWSTYKQECLARGEQSGTSKLTEQQVLEIRARRGEKSQMKLAKEYGVSQNAIANVMLRKTWRHLA